jgi:hypothetical protein
MKIYRSIFYAFRIRIWIGNTGGSFCYLCLPVVNSLEGLRWSRLLPALSDLLDRYLLPFTDEKEGTFQCCGSRIIYSGSLFFPSPDPGSKRSGSRIRIRIKDFKYLQPKKLFLSSRKYNPGCSSRIRILIFYPFRIQGSKRHRIPDPDPQHWYFYFLFGKLILVLDDRFLLTVRYYAYSTVL